MQNGAWNLKFFTTNLPYTCVKSFRKVSKLQKYQDIGDIDIVSTDNKKPSNILVSQFFQSQVLWQLMRQLINKVIWSTVLIVANQLWNIVASNVGVVK